MVTIRHTAQKIGLKQLTVRHKSLSIVYQDNLYPSKEKIVHISEDPSLDIEFPQGDTFLIQVGLTGKSEAEQVEMAKNLLQKLL